MEELTSTKMPGIDSLPSSSQYLAAPKKQQ
jgi:hypothetical protein